MSQPTPYTASADIGHYIAGAPREATGGRSQPVYNPATGAVARQVQLGSVADVDAAVAAAQAGVYPIERVKPVESRLVRVHDCLWLRMWMRPQAGAMPMLDSIEDMVCSIGV